MSSRTSCGWSLGCGLFVLVVLALPSAPCANAGLLGLTEGTPDIDASFISIKYTYKASTQQGNFSATGFADSLNLVGPGASPGSAGRPKITKASGKGYGQFALDLVLDLRSGVVPSSGSLTITGDIPALGIYGSSSSQLATLLSGQATAFGYSTSGSEFTEFDFLFTVTTDGTGKFGVGSSVGG
jgi:hypothetical protein